MTATLDDALKALPAQPTVKWPNGVWDKEVMRHGTMTVSLFAPRGEDHQTPHLQDELYFVMCGSAILRVTTDDGGSQCHAACPGTVLFVAASVPHRFETISDDFAAWVVFWGPNGGE